MPFRHPGHSAPDGVSCLFRLAPHREQNEAPASTSEKHWGQATVASRARQ
jgi:hypothetical protein